MLTSQEESMAKQNSGKNTAPQHVDRNPGKRIKPGLSAFPPDQPGSAAYRRLMAKNNANHRPPRHPTPRATGGAPF